ncbi:hypothetical protein PDJAM_G00079170 [Pangasius djambal]|uniref:Uncharacterized protein n=1 Tax=Pangasius djambal TaxID=1691987 RepID=A0ACC5Z328_9TELE|nr:hypothetical protein [Pangasius djambal]
MDSSLLQRSGLVRWSLEDSSPTAFKVLEEWTRPRGRGTSETTEFQREDSVPVIGVWFPPEGRRHDPPEASDTLN